jgi:DNA repair protein RadC
MKTSVNKVKKSMVSYIREIKAQYTALNTERIKLADPKAVVSFIKSQIGDECREHFITLCVNMKNEVLSYSLVSIGTVSEAIVHPREVFTPAILSGASGIIISHNHPSGLLQPSSQDMTTTKRMCDAGKIIGIPVFDHIIVGFDSDDYYSIKENGGM